MSLLEFVRRNRADIDTIIITHTHRADQQYNDTVRAAWVRACEPLYRYAKEQGVKL